MVDRKHDGVDLTGRVAIVTGASAEGDGITNGRAAAMVLAGAGAQVVCVARQYHHVARTVEMIEEEGGKGLAVAADVAVEADCRRVVDETLEAFGRIDYLDNNVGEATRGDVVNTDIEIWRHSWQVNVESQILMSKYAVPAMREVGGGSIVNIGSLRAIRPQELGPYATTKGAVMALTRSMAVEHGSEGIRVNCVVIGPVLTAKMVTNMSPERREMRKNASLLKREGTPWDTAMAVRFFLSDQSLYVTGQSLIVDGGVSATSPTR